MQINLLKFRVSTLVIFLLTGLTVVAQVTIGSTQKPMSGSLLDLKEDGVTNKGLGLPRVKLEHPDYLYPMFKGDDDYENNISGSRDIINIAHAGLLVYNMNEDMCKRLYSGLYVWSGIEWISMNGPREVISTDKYGGANSYVVLRNSSVNIPVERAFKIWRDYASASATPTTQETAEGRVLDLGAVNNLQGTLTASIVWEETGEQGTSGVLKGVPEISGTGENAILTVKAGSKTGNALVYVSVDGFVLWQWHIWVLDNDPTSETATKYCYNNGQTTYVFMDRNLGATNNTLVTDTMSSAYGLYYQWGRPTPMKRFGSSVDAKFVGSTPTLNLLRALTTPTFIRTVVEVEPHDWYTDVDETSASLRWNSRWGHNEGKSPFDPCPYGWRVPSWTNNTSPWSNLTRPAAQSFSNGWNFNEDDKLLGYWSAAGRRNSFNGELNLLGTFASYWTASYNGRSGTNLSFSNTLMSPASTNHRALGISVRCVQEYY